MIRADYNWAFSRFFGLGAGVFANFNSIQSPVGFNLKLTMGMMRKKQKGNNKNVLIKHVHLKQINNAIMKKIMIYFLMLALPQLVFVKRQMILFRLVKTDYLVK